MSKDASVSQQVAAQANMRPTFKRGNEASNLVYKDEKTELCPSEQAIRPHNDHRTFVFSPLFRYADRVAAVKYDVRPDGIQHSRYEMRLLHTLSPSIPHGQVARSCWLCWLTC